MWRKCDRPALGREEHIDEHARAEASRGGTAGPTGSHCRASGPPSARDGSSSSRQPFPAASPDRQHPRTRKRPKGRTIAPETLKVTAAPLHPSAQRPAPPHSHRDVPTGSRDIHLVRQGPLIRPEALGAGPAASYPFCCLRAPPRPPRDDAARHLSIHIFAQHGGRVPTSRGRPDVLAGPGRLCRNRPRLPVPP